MTSTTRSAPERHEPQDSRPILAITLKVVSVVSFVGMSTCLKKAGDLPVGQLIFFRSAFALVPIFIMLAWQRQLIDGMKTKKPFSHITRSMIGVCAMGCGFFALTRLPLPEAVTLNYAQPLLVVVFSAIFLHEVVRVYRWSAVVVGFIGVLIISWPSLSAIGSDSIVDRNHMIGVVAALSGAACSAVAMLLIRRMVKTERSATVVLWFTLTCTIVGLLTIPFGWSSLDWQQFTLLTAAGLLGGVAQILMTEGYRHAEASTVAPFEYTSMVWAIAAGYFVFGDVASINMIVGGLVVVASGLFIIWRERRLGLKRAAAKSATPPGI